MESAFAKAQIHAGADLIGIGDAAASLVGPDIYRDFVFPAEKRLISTIQDAGAFVRLHICGNISPLFFFFCELGCDILDLDSMVSINDARSYTGRNQILSGNIDPVRVLRNGTPDSVLSEIATCQKNAGENYVVGAGCEIPRDTPKENLHVLRNFARTFRV